MSVVNVGPRVTMEALTISTGMIVVFTTSSAFRESGNVVVVVGNNVSTIVRDVVAVYQGQKKNIGLGETFEKFPAAIHSHQYLITFLTGYC